MTWDKWNDAHKGKKDTKKRWGNSAITGVGVNSPAMMKARAKFDADKTMSSRFPDWEKHKAEYLKKAKAAEKKGSPKHHGETKHGDI